MGVFTVIFFFWSCFGFLVAQLGRFLFTLSFTKQVVLLTLSFPLYRLSVVPLLLVVVVNFPPLAASLLGSSLHSFLLDYLVVFTSYFSFYLFSAYVLLWSSVCIIILISWHNCWVDDRILMMILCFKCFVIWLSHWGIWYWFVFKLHFLTRG